MWVIASTSWVMLAVGFVFGISIRWIPKREDKLYHQIKIVLPGIEVEFFI